MLIQLMLLNYTPQLVHVTCPSFLLSFASHMCLSHFFFFNMLYRVFAFFPFSPFSSQRAFLGKVKFLLFNVKNNYFLYYIIGI